MCALLSDSYCEKPKPTEKASSQSVSLSSEAVSSSSTPVDSGDGRMGGGDEVTKKSGWGLGLRSSASFGTCISRTGPGNAREGLEYDSSPCSSLSSV